MRLRNPLTGIPVCLLALTLFGGCTSTTSTGGGDPTEDTSNTTDAEAPPEPPRRYPSLIQ